MPWANRSWRVLADLSPGKKTPLDPSIGGVLNVSHHLLDLGPDGFYGRHVAQVDGEYHGSCPHCPPINLSWRGSDLAKNSPEKRDH